MPSLTRIRFLIVPCSNLFDCELVGCPWTSIYLTLAIVNMVEVIETIGEELATVDVIPEAKQILKDIGNNSKAFLEFVERFVSKIEDKQLSTAKGISLLELKNFTLLNYLIDLTYIVLRKCKGQSIEGNRAIKRLVETRTTLEKMKPIHFKLKYRIDKLIRAANTGAVNVDDPLRLRPKPDELLIENEGNGSEEDEDMDEEDEDNVDKPRSSVRKSKDEKYVPPKVSAVHYDEDDSVETRKKTAFEKAKRRAFSTSVIQELRSEFDEGPEEIAESTVGRKKQNKLVKERQRYEEEYMVRLNVTKKERSRENRHGFTTMTSLTHDLTRFENISVLDRDNPDEEGPAKKRKLANGKSEKGKKPTSKKKKKFAKFKK